MIDREVAKELLHVRDWLDRAQEVVDRGKEIYLADGLLQEAGDSLMMKLDEASNGLSRAGIEGPDGVSWPDVIANRNWLIHQYDEIDREITWTTLARDLPRWRQAPDRPRPVHQTRGGRTSRVPLLWSDGSPEADGRCGRADHRGRLRRDHPQGAGDPRCHRRQDDDDGAAAGGRRR